MRILKNGEDLLRRARKRMDESSDQAEDYAKNPGKLERLVLNAKDKLMHMENRRHNLKNMVRHVSVFVRLSKDYSSGYYPNLPWRSFLSIVGAILYFVNPFDVIPDFIPGIGLLDDITLLGWVYKSIENDVDDYLSWEEQRTASTR